MASVRAQRALEGVVTPGDEDNDRWPFPCAWVCSACGYLRRPEDRPNTHPLRFDQELEAGITTPCPHCAAAASSAIDLADKAMARSLIDGELHDQQHAPRMRPVVGQLLVGAAAAGVGTALLVSGLALVAGVAGLGSAGVAWAKAASDWKALRGRTRAPRRWFHAPQPQAPSSTASGVEVTGESLQAPLSGRPCLAYEVSVRWAHGEPTDPRTIALVEQKVGALNLEGDSPDPARVFLELPAVPIGTAAFADRESARIYLASRGLTTTDGEFVFAESILAAHTRVDVVRDAEGGALVRPTAPDGHGDAAPLDVG